MKRLCLALLGLSCWLSTSPPATAVEPYLEFVQGLRAQGYNDFAELYLQSLVTKPGVPKDVKDLVPYEMGVTLRDEARRLLIPEEQRSKLDEALASFERFVKASPNHPLAGRANSERAGMLVEKARVDVWDADGESEPQVKRDLRANARKLITQARGIFQTAVTQLQKEFEKFPGFIPEDERDQRTKRAAAEAEYIQAQLDMAETQYWEAQTYDPADAKRKELLTSAMLEFEKVHTAYRSMVGGLYARLWQGKCLEEMGSIGEALGIYGELLKHDGSSPSMVALKAKARQFQLICYNHDAKKEFQLVNQLALDWMKADENRRIKYTDTGKAIEWEQARALEQLGQDRAVAENERNTYLNQAIGIARGLSRRPGPLKAPSASMVARLSRLLGRDGDDPRDFSTAYGRADELFQQAQQVSDKMASAQRAGKIDEAVKHAEALKGVASEMTRLLDMGLKFTDAGTDETLQRRAELMLAVGYVYQQRPYEAAAVAQFFLRNYGQGQPEMVRLAGEIALSALNDAYQQAEGESREFEKRHILKLADLLATRWPGTEIAVGAHFSAARLAWDDKDYALAAETWNKIPASSDSYGAAQLKAGAAYLEQYNKQSQLPELERPPAEALNKLRDAAEQHLQTGVDVETQRTAAATLNDDLIRGKLALAQVRNLIGLYTTKDKKLGAIELLTAAPHSVVQAVSVAAKDKRPTDPAELKSAVFASIVYQQLLRAYIGIRNIDAARDARAKLEQIGAGGDAGSLTQVFVAFGQQLEDELNQLKAAGDTERLADVRAGFEAFLKDLYDRDDSQQTFNSLLWIAETYASLGEGSADDPGKSTEYFDRAATAYQRILDKSQADPQFTGAPQNALAVRLRLVNGRMRQKDFPSAETILVEIIKEAPTAPNVQETAAQLYQQWGESGETSKFEVALKGSQQPAPVWGWGDLASRMRGQRDRPELRLLGIEATYRYAQTYSQYAQHKSGDERKRLLEGAKSVLTTFARTTREVPDETWDRINALYATVLTDLGEPVHELERGGGVQTAGQSPGPSATRPGQAGVATPGPAAPTAEADEPEGPNNVLNGLILLVLAVIGGGAVFGIMKWTASQSKKQRAARLAAVAESTTTKKKRPKAPAESP
jgi:hypothetical protein